MNKYKLITFLDHTDQARKDALQWIKANNPDLTDKEIEAYQAGFIQGKNDALNILKLHAGLKIQ